MVSLPSLPTLDPIVFQFQFGFDAAADAQPPAPPGNNVPEAGVTSADSRAPSMRKVAFVRNDGSEMGGDAAIPEPDPVSVPEAVAAPASTDIPEGIVQEVVPDAEKVDTTTVPAADETVVTAVDEVLAENPAENPAVEQIETVEAPEPTPGIQKSTTVVITVPADEAVEGPEEVVLDEAPKLRRSNTTITVTVASENPVPSRRASLAAPRTAFVAVEPEEAPFEAPRKTETILEGGTSVIVTEAAPEMEQPQVEPPKAGRVPRTPKSARFKKTTVTRVRVLSLWRRIIGKILRKRAEKKVQQAAQVDGSNSPEAGSGVATRSLSQRPSIRRSEPEASVEACKRHGGQSPRMGVDEYFLHDNAAQPDMKNPTLARVSREEPRAESPDGS